MSDSQNYQLGMYNHLGAGIAGNYGIGSYGQSEPRSIFGNDYHIGRSEFENLQLRYRLAEMRRNLDLNQAGSGFYAPDLDAIDKILSSPPPAVPPVPPPPGTRSGPMRAYASPPKSQPAFPHKPGAGPNKQRNAAAGDVLKAVLEVPQVKFAADKIETEAERVWKQLTTFESVYFVSHTVMIGSGIVAGIVSDDAARLFILNNLSGVDIPVLGTDGRLHFRFYAQNGEVYGGGASYQDKKTGLKASVGVQIGKIPTPDQKLPPNTTYDSMNFTLTGVF